MNIDRIIEIAILVTLWIEFFYDAIWNNRERRLKRHRQARKKPEWENLTQGEHK